MEFGPVIKNPVLDINKLVRQGTMLNQSVQNVEGDSTADQATVNLLARKDPVIHEISVGISGEEASLYTVSGTPPLSLPNSLGKPLKAWSVDVLPYQEGSGDPSPDNVRPIHGTDKLTITTAGKNLLNETEYSLASNHGFIGLSHLTGLEGNTVTLTIANGSSVGIMPKIALSYSGASIWSDTSCASGATKSYTLVLTEAMTSAKLYFISTSTYTQASDEEIALCDIQLEIGSTATPYTPYIAPSQTVLTLPQTVYTGTIGSEGGESRWGELDLGTLNWTYVGTAGAEYFYSVFSPKATNTITELGPLLSSQYKQMVYSTLNGHDGTIGINAGGNVVKVCDLRYTDTTAFKSAMSGVQLVYELATPTTFAVPSATIPTPTGTATTWATAEDGTVDGMEVTYVGKA